MQQELLPLFPLEMVLLPGAKAPLHIFEDRYKEMIGEAIRGGSEFGIVLTTGKGILKAGCTAVVEQVVKEYDDGRFDIVAGGRRRFEILSLDEDRSYLRGRVEFYDDEDTSAPEAGVQARVEAAFAQMLLVQDDAETPAAGSEAPLSFRVASLVRDLNFKQLMLASRSEAERLKHLAEFLPGVIERTRRTGEARVLAGHNGHAKHIQS